MSSHSKALSALPGRMSIHARQRFPTFHFEYRVILDSALRPPSSNVKSQRFLLFHVECRVTLESAFCCSRSNVESHSTAFSVVPGRMSSHSTAPSALRGRMSSHIRQGLPTFRSSEYDSTFELEQWKALSSMTRHSTWMGGKRCRV